MDWNAPCFDCDRAALHDDYDATTKYMTISDVTISTDHAKPNAFN